MSNLIKINGNQNFMGKNIPIVEGGFGENQKVILAKTIAEIHEIELRDLNKLINNNIEEFEFNIDILDLKNDENFAVVAKNSEIYSTNALNASKNIYLLSEQGYMALVMLMRTEKAKSIRKQLRKEYFTMKSIITSMEQQKANLLLSIYNGGQEGVVASKQLVDIEVKEATKPLLEEIKHKEEVIIGYVDEVDLMTKRQRITQIIRHNAKGKYPERWALLNNEFEKKYHMDLKRRIENCDIKPKIKGKVDYIDRVLNMIPQLYELACKLYENDVKQLMKVWENTVS